MLRLIDGKYEHGELITDYKDAASVLGYTEILGEFYITEMECIDAK